MMKEWDGPNSNTVATESTPKRVQRAYSHLVPLQLLFSEKLTDENHNGSNDKCKHISTIWLVMRTMAFAEELQIWIDAVTAERLKSD